MTPLLNTVTLPWRRLNNIGNYTNNIGAMTTRYAVLAIRSPGGTSTALGLELVEI